VDLATSQEEADVCAMYVETSVLGVGADEYNVDFTIDEYEVVDAQPDFDWQLEQWLMFGLP
jgi:hypothetical protein